MTTIGINVIETDGSAAPAIAGAPSSVAAVILRSRRGPTDRAVRVSNFRQFTQRFGGHDTAFTGAYAMEGLFGNGGREANIVRVVGAGAAAARVTLVDRSGTATLRVGAGYRGVEEAGSWGNELSVEVRDNPELQIELAANRAGHTPARLQGTAFAGDTVDLTVAAAAAPRRLQLAIDGTNFDVSFDAASVPVLAAATPEDVADAINAVAGSHAIASASAGGLLIVSRKKAAASKVEAATGVDNPTRTLLGLAGAAATGAAAAGSYDEIEVVGFGTLKAGDWIRLEDTLTSDWHKVVALETRTPAPGQVQRIVQFASPAASQKNEYRTQDGARVSTTEFDLRVSRRAPGDERPGVVETWEKVSMDAAAARYAPALINDRFTGSAFVVVEDQAPAPATYTGREAPALGAGVTLGEPTPGTAGLVRQLGADGGAPAAAAFRNALSLFDTIAVQLLLVPEVMPASLLALVTRSALDYCAARGDCMYVGHTPAGRDQLGARDFGQGFRAAKAYGALYWPWIGVLDPVGPTPTRVIPPSGHIAGVYARIDSGRGLWKAPAGDEALVRGALDVETRVTDEDHTDLVKNGSVNGIRPIQGVGIVLDASRTLSTDTRWLYVNVRLLFNFVKASLRDGLRWVKQEPNREPLWGMIRFGTVTPFLLRLYQAGAFGPGKPEDVFAVVCGPENNPPDQIALGNLSVEVSFYPSRPAETILIIVGQQDGGATAGES